MTLALAKPPTNSDRYAGAIAQTRFRKEQKQLLAHLLEIIARDQVPDRPWRGRSR